MQEQSLTGNASSSNYALSQSDRNTIYFALAASIASFVFNILFMGVFFKKEPLAMDSQTTLKVVLGVLLPIAVSIFSLITSTAMKIQQYLRQDYVSAAYVSIGISALVWTLWAIRLCIERRAQLRAAQQPAVVQMQPLGPGL